jgi:RNA 2',3'-cyclic 3'-phosphodiesterase
VRLFVAIELGEAVIHAAVELILELRRRAVGLAPTARVTWLTPDRLHVTLAFIGDADAARTSAIAGCLRAPFAGPSFDMSIAGLAAFPGRGTPRVLWAGVEEGRDRLLRLETELHVRCPPALIPSDERPYHPHLTLARVREADGLRAASLLEGLERIALGTSRVEAITLFESRLSPKGPTYVPLQRTGVVGG